MTNTRKGDVMLDIITRMIIEENKELLKIIASKYQKNYKELEEKYIRPEYYLPLVRKCTKS